MLVLVVGTVAVAVASASALVAGRVLARRLVPDADAGCTGLATVVLALTLVLSVGQALGAVGQLRPWATFAAVVCLSVLVALAAAPTPRAARHSSVDSGGPRHWVRRQTWWQWPAHAAVVAVVVRWLAMTGDALESGMKQPDTLWYHGPFAARFAQEHGFAALDGLGYAAARWFPFDAHLIHALGILAVDSDALSPFVNLAWGALALAAAHTIGRRHGRAPLTTLAAAAVLGLPILAATQPGQASTDIPVAALCLTAVALLLSTTLTTGTLVVAGCALGLAVSTKTTAAAFAAVMAVAVLGVLLRRRHLAGAGAWTASIAGTATFWFARNWVLTGNPFPWFDLPGFDKQVDQDGPALIRTVFDAGAWRDRYVDGMAQGLTVLWPLLVALLVGAIVALLVRGSSIQRAIGVAITAGLVLHVLTPLTGGLTFAFNLRYLAPTLLVAVVVLPTAVPRGDRRSVVIAVPLVALVVAGALSDHREGAPPWTFPATTWALVAIAVAGAAALASRRRVVIGVGVALAVVVVAPLLEQRYLDGRYVDAGLVGDAINPWFRDVHDERIGVLGTDETLPFFGLHLDNHVELAVDPHDPPRGDACTWWRARFGDRYDVVVLYGESYGFGLYYRPSVELLTSDPSVTVARRDRDTYVLRVAVDGFDPDACTATG